MTHPLFSETGQRRLQALKRRPFLVGLDFDGTLVPIAKNHQKVRLGLPAKKLLQKLAVRRPTVVISGRAKADVEKHLLGCKVCVVGNHGLEGLLLTEKAKRLSEEHVRIWARQLLPELSKFPGVELENKRFSLSIHYRQAKNREYLKKKLVSLIADLPHRPRLIPGKLVLNVLPLGAGDKGKAFRTLMSKLHYSCGIYIGDDLTDEEVFKLPQRCLLTVRIGASKKSHAKFHLNKQKEILRLFNELI